MHSISIDVMKSINTRKELLELLGPPHCISMEEMNIEQWDYRYETISIFRLEYKTHEYHYLLNDKDEVIKKTIQIIDRKLRLLPSTELPEDFDEFR